MGRGTLLALSLILAGCQAGKVPAGPEILSAEAQALAGRRAAPQLERQYGGTYADPAIEARVAAVGRRLGQQLRPESRRCQFFLLASEQVNAFSLPGGLIYVTRGLCRRVGDDDGLLAATIAHEMSHIFSGDSLKPACGTARESLQRETEADAGAAALLRVSGSSPADLARLMDLTADVQPDGWAEARKASLAGTLR